MDKHILTDSLDRLSQHEHPNGTMLDPDHLQWDLQGVHGDVQGLLLALRAKLDEFEGQEMQYRVVASFLDSIDDQDNTILQTVCEALWSDLETHKGMERLLFRVSKTLAEIAQAEEAYGKAAGILGRVQMDGAGYTDTMRFEHCVCIAEYLLEDQNGAQAHKQLAKAPKDADVESGLLLRHKACSARIMESLRRYTEAGSKYFELSHSSIPEHDQLESLRKSLCAALVSKPGIDRQRLLNKLNNDARTVQVAGSDVLDRLCSHRLVSSQQCKQLEELVPPSLAAPVHGTSPVSRGILEHNMHCIARIYDMIGYSRLASLLDIHRDHIEDLVRSMVNHNQLQASLDGVTDTVYFKSGEEEGESRQIESFCNELQSIAVLIRERYPDLSGQ